MSLSLRSRPYGVAAQGKRRKKTEDCALEILRIVHPRLARNPSRCLFSCCMWCIVVCLFSFGRRQAADTRPRPFAGIAVVYQIARLSESKLGFPPRGGEREESTFHQQQPVFMGGKPSTKSSLLLEAANFSTFQGCNEIFM